MYGCVPLTVFYHRLKFDSNRIPHTGMSCPHTKKFRESLKFSHLSFKFGSGLRHRVTGDIMVLKYDFLVAVLIFWAIITFGSFKTI